jgi:hypothetical protein
LFLCDWNKRRPLRSPFRCWTVWFHLSRFVCSPEVPDPQGRNAALEGVFQAHGNIIDRDETWNTMDPGISAKKRAARASRPLARCQP